MLIFTLLFLEVNF